MFYLAITACVHNIIWRSSKSGLYLCLEKNRDFKISDRESDKDGRNHASGPDGKRRGVCTPEVRRPQGMEDQNRHGNHEIVKSTVPIVPLGYASDP